MAFSHDAHKALIVDFLDAIDQRREPTVSGREALNVQLLIEAMLQSSQSAQTVTIT
jgi:UDP-N-acetyl-2-amino-2-deoxyglucuronate dehydrogenase